MRYSLHRCILGVSLAVATALGACAEPGASPLSPAVDVKRANDVITDLNPQPEPPSLALDFVLNPDGTDWSGTIYVGNQACGSMQLVQTASRESGIVTHVGFTLGIQGANPDFQMDATLAGVVVRGRVVLNGLVGNGAYAGQTIHPRGEILVPPPGSPIDLSTTMTGIVQLNPQPEPPSPAYPPSPCVAG